MDQSPVWDEPDTSGYDASVAEEARILVAISFHYSRERFVYLEQVVSTLQSFPVAQIDIVIETNTAAPNELTALSEIGNRRVSETRGYSVRSHPQLEHGFLLTWCHKSLITDVFLAANSPYSHFIYLEDDMRFDFQNFIYFLSFREILGRQKLIPSFLRVEYSGISGAHVNTENTSPVNLAATKAQLRHRDLIFSNVPSPYCAMFVLDQRLAREYVDSPSFDRKKSESVRSWGIRERAAMGLTFESIPEGFSSRYVVPVSTESGAPPECCWVYHLPNNYANDPKSKHGKIRMNELFSLRTMSNAGQQKDSEVQTILNSSEAVHFIRNAPMENLASPEWVEHELLPALGFAENALPFLPQYLHPNCGKGLLSFQSPNQFAKYLCYLSDKKIESYLEIGVFQGGTFIITVEYLSRFHPIRNATAVDLAIRAPMRAYAAMNPAVALFEGPSRTPAMLDILKSRRWDLALIDGDHSEAGCRSDYLAVRDRARIVALHDTFNDVCPGVEAVWEEVKKDVAPQYIREFHDQYEEIVSKEKRYFGIGLADRTASTERRLSGLGEARSLTVTRHEPLSKLASHVESSFSEALFASKFEGGIYDIEGMSGRRYRYFINGLVRSMADPRYLEVGSWAGSTLCAAIHGNVVRAVAIDNWSLFGGPKQLFLENVAKFSTPGVQMKFIEQDFRLVDYEALGRHNIFLFDGPHGYKDQYDALTLTSACLDKEFVFIVDDWNWAAVRQGTHAAIKDCGLKPLFQAELRTTLDDSHPPHDGKNAKSTDWHNGYYISVLARA